jgi:hypothetical protein
MMKKLLLMILCLLMTTTVALADWDPRDGHKMHYPQLPDPFGWDVNATEPMVLADDWRCSQTGPVSDIHFWGSWMNDEVGEITNIHVSIHSDVPADPPGVPFSHPGPPLWERDYSPGQFSVWGPETGDQGWYDPSMATWNENDHEFFYQYNIENIQDPHMQFEGTIYWLDISVSTSPGSGTWGWKTSLDHWNDDAVWLSEGNWVELIDPISGVSLDLAFVITPIPGAVWILGSLLLGGVGVRRFRK